VLGTSGDVYLLGGGWSTALLNDLSSSGFTTHVLSGADRYATAVKIAQEIVPQPATPDLVLVSTGRNFPDGLAAGAAAGSYHAPGSGYKAVALLSADGVLPAATKTYLNSVLAANPNVLVAAIGGQASTALTAAYGPNLALNLVGSTRYETAAITGLV